MTLQGYFLTLLQGLPVTLSLSVAGIFTACLLAIILSLLLSLNKKYLNRVIRAYLIAFTGTPLLVQLFLIYYGPAQFNQIKQYLPHLWSLLSSPWFCAYLALSLNSAAYTTQIFYGALKAVPSGQWQACSALGMTKFQSLRIILPYALKRAMSSYSNEVIFVVKGTALASTITLMDVMGYNQLLNGRYYDFSILILTGLIYLVINGLLSVIMRLIEWRALKFERI
ncbi:L-arginine ABC transporter membrane protein [Orbus hercynius]|uniref:Arginine ABC transporter permease protein ArtM n=1 Tax=Orbus hercynius TaxID=593135 RepID=A0A495RJS6_9GAMM|nr:arginine ABC transporter permease ArtM [Orbus hercynius]RKS87550.1 L-arginine ABC transporter membrane protein [Orbus hercynius]